MYLKTIEAVRKYMLYRPMVPDSRDILFSGSVRTAGPDKDDVRLTAEVEHLTCFIGGMVGMSAKIFGLEGDLEIAKKLTDGCVWAYEVTPSGIMPEGAIVMPCTSAEHCTWNETAYYDFLDPSGAQRDKNVEIYEEKKAIREAEAKQAAEVEAIRLAALDKVEAGAAEAGAAHPETDINNEVTESNGNLQNYDPTDPSKATPALEKSEPALLQKRALTPSEQSYKDKSKSTEAELQEMSTVGRGRKPPPVFATEPTAPNPLVDPMKPLGHKEFVQSRIKLESLPPGFVTIKSRKYILRYLHQVFHTISSMLIIFTDQKQSNLSGTCIA